MKAAQIKAPRSIHLIEIDDPVLSDCPTDHIVVQLRRACLCGSDAPFFTYDLTDVRVEPLEQLTMHSEHLDLGGNEVYPLRPGQSLHECAGDVIASG